MGCKHHFIGIVHHFPVLGFMPLSHSITIIIAVTFTISIIIFYFVSVAKLFLTHKFCFFFPILLPHCEQRECPRST